MIIELLYKLIFGLADLLLSVLPSIDLNFDLPDTTFFREMLGLADYFFPVGTLVAALGVIITVQNAQFFVKIFNWIIKKIPFIG